MKINNKNLRTIEASHDKSFVKIIDQTCLPYELIIRELYSLEDIIYAIKTMQVRGAPLIGVSGSFGLALALKDDVSDKFIVESSNKLINSRPTAVNLSWAVKYLSNLLLEMKPEDRFDAAWAYAQAMADDDVNTNKKIGLHGLELLKKHGEKINILTHCNAGWLATVDYGTALSPIFLAKEAGFDIHVWVSETRPRNQGTNLTAWELEHANIDHTIIADNSAGLIMQQGKVDCVLVGADRIAFDGQVVNKIGTFLKSLAAKEYQIPFYVAAPLSTVDVNFKGDHQPFEIEYRDANELLTIKGINKKGIIETLKIGTSPGLNPAFDLTPAKFVTKIICEKGIFAPNNIGIQLND